MGPQTRAIMVARTNQIWRSNKPIDLRKHSAWGNSEGGCEAALFFERPQHWKSVSCSPSPCLIGSAYETVDELRFNASMESRGGNAELKVDAELDLRGVICPYNFVKTKLRLETMEPGQVLAVILD